VLKDKIDGLMDSKQLSEKRRNELYPKIIANSIYHIVSFDAQTIDRDGISKCLNVALNEIKEHIEDCDYLFDGNSTFGVSGISTMVKADAKIAEVSAASILAKVTRDKEMIEYDKTYPEYGFAKHKGYATKAHYEALKVYDRSPIHRKSFRVKCLDEKTLF